MPFLPRTTPPATPARRPSSPGPAVSRRATLGAIGIGGLTAALGLTAAPRLAGAHSGDTDAHHNVTNAPVSVVGAWNLAFRREDAAAGFEPTRILAAFGAEGGVQAALAPTWRTGAGAARFHGGGLGSWSTNAGGVVVAAYSALIYDESGAYEGARHVILSLVPDSPAFLTGLYESRLFDADGNLVALGDGLVVGTPAGIPAADSVADDVAPQPGQPGWPF